MFFAWLVWMSVGVPLKWVKFVCDPPSPHGVTLPSWHGDVAVCPWCAMGGGPSHCMQPLTMLCACEVCLANLDNTAAAAAGRGLHGQKAGVTAAAAADTYTLTAQGAFCWHTTLGTPCCCSSWLLAGSLRQLPTLTLYSWAPTQRCLVLQPARDKGGKRGGGCYTCCPPSEKAPLSQGLPGCLAAAAGWGGKGPTGWATTAAENNDRPQAGSADCTRNQCTPFQQHRPQNKEKGGRRHDQQGKGCAGEPNPTRPHSSAGEPSGTAGRGGCVHRVPRRPTSALCHVSMCLLSLLVTHARCRGLTQLGTPHKWATTILSPAGGLPTGLGGGPLHIQHTVLCTNSTWPPPPGNACLTYPPEWLW
jgi:hypothetical protein